MSKTSKAKLVPKNPAPEDFPGENVSWEEFTPDQKTKFASQIEGISWKREGDQGPVWVMFKFDEVDTFMNDLRSISRNYRNGMKMSMHNRYYADWLPRGKAIRIAHDLGVEFHEG